MSTSVKQAIASQALGAPATVSFLSSISRRTFALFGLIALFMNLLYAIKYGPRISIDPLGAGVLFALYFVVQVALSAGITAFAVRIKKSGLLLTVVVVAYTSAAYAVYRAMDPYALDVDRWSALKHFWDAFFRGEFPWLAITHLGTHISGFPGMHALALPFYWLGDVGLLQFAALIAFVALMVVRYRESARPLFLTLIVLGMPIFHYQVFTRSDLVGNCVVIAWLMHLCLRPGVAKGGRLFVWAVAWGLALSTRAIFVIPFIYVAWRLVEGRGFKAMAGFGLVVVATFAATFLPFYLWDPVLFWSDNPYRIQSSFVSREILIAVLVASIVLGYLKRRSEATFLYSGMTVFITLILCWALKSMSVGWSGALWWHGFDITYFFLALPFLILALGDLMAVPMHKSEIRSSTP